MAKKKPQNPEILNYACLVTDLKAILEVEKIWLDKAVNQIKIQVSWKIGERIYQELESQAQLSGYATPIYQKLSKDLNLTSKYLSATVRFFHLYSCPQRLSSELTWSHYYELITIDDEKVRRFYELHAISQSWTVRKLREKIRKKEHEKFEKAQIPLPQPVLDIPEVDQVIKNTYHFDFIQVPKAYSERDLERALINQIGKFLIELGTGFFFVGNQYKIVIAGNYHHVDLVFFHAQLACYVLIDLKIQKFEDTFVGQMNKYLRYFREHINLPYMRPPIGLIICKSVNNEEVYYALEGLEKKIFIAEYKLYLPKTDDMLKALQKESTNFATMKVSARQNRMLKKLPRKKTFTIRQYQELASVSISTAQRDIQQLLKMNLLLKKGSGKNTCYSLVNN